MPCCWPTRAVAGRVRARISASGDSWLSANQSKLTDDDAARRALAAKWIGYDVIPRSQELQDVGGRARRNRRRQLRQLRECGDEIVARLKESCLPGCCPAGKHERTQKHNTQGGSSPRPFRNAIDLEALCTHTFWYPPTGRRFPTRP